VSPFLVQWLARVSIILVLLVAPLILNTYRLGLLGEILIFGLAAASVDLLIGYTGLPTLGHAALFGLGGYAAGLLMTNYTGNLFLALVAAIAVGAVFAVVTGIVAVRAHGIYFLMLTLAFAELVRSLAISWNSLTGGTDGLAGIPQPTLLPNGEIELDLVGRYYFVVVSVLLAYWLMRRFVDSPFGRSLVGIATNPDRMRSLGYAVHRRMVIAYVVAGMVGAFAGGLHASFTRFVSPEIVTLKISAFLLVMVLLGGVRRLYGAMLGALMVILLREELTARFGTWELGLGMLMLLIVYFLPHGLSGIVDRRGESQRMRRLQFHRSISEPKAPTVAEDVSA
jgi:branched-chain amino acid transport system permease protein